MVRQAVLAWLRSAIPLYLAGVGMVVLLSSLQAYDNCWSGKNVTLSPGGEACSLENQRIPCRCSDYVQWFMLSGARQYQIERCSVTYVRLNVRDDCVTVGTTTETFWYFSDDRPLAKPYRKSNRRLYRYRIRGTNDQHEGGWSNAVYYAPTDLRYVCYYPDGSVKKCP